MNTDTVLYIAHLKTISVSRGGNAFQKKWAHLWLREIEFQKDLTCRSRETLNRINDRSLRMLEPAVSR
jgi:hypothetical protein